MTALSTRSRQANSTLTNGLQQRAVDAIARLALVPQPQVAAEAASSLAGRPDTDISVRSCSLCGDPISGGMKCNPRRRCDECNRVNAWVLAAFKAIERMEGDRQRRARRQLMAAVGGVPALRDKSGRFVKVAR